MFVYISDNNLSESRIRAVCRTLKNYKDGIFIITSPCKSAFERYAVKLTKTISIYNRSDYIEPHKVLSTLWGFKRVWIFHRDSTEHFDLSESFTAPWGKEANLFQHIREQHESRSA